MDSLGPCWCTLTQKFFWSCYTQVSGQLLLISVKSGLQTGVRGSCCWKSVSSQNTASFNKNKQTKRWRWLLLCYLIRGSPRTQRVSVPQGQVANLPVPQSERNDPEPLPWSITEVISSACRVRPITMSQQTGFPQGTSQTERWLPLSMGFLVGCQEAHSGIILDLWWEV